MANKCQCELLILLKSGAIILKIKNKKKNIAFLSLVSYYTCALFVLDKIYMYMYTSCVKETYSAARLTVATQQTFLQGSQSGYTNVIDGHASLQSWRVNLSSEQFGLGR